MINYVTVEKFEIDLSKADSLPSALRMLENAGVDLNRLKVIKYDENNSKLHMQRVISQPITKAELIAAATKTGGLSEVSPQRRALRGLRPL